MIGRDGIRWVDNSSKQKVLENPSFQGYLDRNIRWLGEEGQRKISETHLVICGLGGLGSFLIANARGLGFGKITLIDPDRVEESNLNRLVGASRADMGEFKVKVMAREIRKIDPRMQVCPLPIRVEESKAHNPIASGDIIVSAMDGMGPRMEVQILAAKYLKPLLDLGAGISLNHEKNKGMKEVTSMGGQLIFYLPGGPCLSCQGIIRPEEITSGLSAEIRKAVGYVQGTDITPSSVATINSVIVGMAMDLLVRYLTGFARVPLYISYDLLSHSITRFNFQKKPECPICGENGVEGKGDEETKLLEPPRTLNNMNSIPFFPFPLICI